MTLANPLVSVIIPAYNVSDYIFKSVSSILDQTYRNLEIWIIDDASTDDTLKKIKQIQDDRIIVRSFERNTQKVGAVNEVLALVKGDYICFQDADDWSEPGRIERQIKQLQADPQLGICFTGYRFSGSGQTSSGRIALDNESLQNEFLQFGLNARPEGKLPTLCASMMITKNVLGKTGGYHPYFAGRVAEDIQWVYRILKDFKGCTLTEPLYVYHSREGSFSAIQAGGSNAKYAYSWALLSKIIYYDVHMSTDVLSGEQKDTLKELELQACEETLVRTLKELSRTKKNYEESMSYKIGSYILFPWKLIRSVIKNATPGK